MKENMFYGASPIIFQRAEELRDNMTAAEKIIWDALHINEWHLKFRRQHPVGSYIADFYCHSIKLVIEIDGEIHENKEVKEMDEYRESFLKEIGLTVLRFKNEEVFNQRQSVLKKIAHAIKAIQNNITFQKESNIPVTLSGDGVKSTLHIIKIGGSIIDDENKLFSFLKDFAAIDGKKILVHGGGKLATQLASQLNIPQQLVDGRRITDAETLKVVTMVYAGYINKNIVAKLQACNCNAVGLTGADGDLITAHKRTVTPSGDGGVDYGFAGDINAINIELIQSLLEKNISLAIAPITHDKQGQLLNTNADTIAQELAKALSSLYSVSLIYSFEKRGVLTNAEDERTIIHKIDATLYHDLKQSGAIFAGMIPKLDNAFSAINNGVKKVVIGKAEHITQLIKGESGTTISN